MATSSILGGTRQMYESSGKDVHSLGPSDNSDSGSDATGAYGADELASDTDAAGTGERSSVDERDGGLNADILPDHVESTEGVLDTLPDGEEMASDDEVPDADDTEGIDDVDDIVDLEDSETDQDDEAGPA